MLSETTIQAVKEVSAFDIIGHYVELKKRSSEYLGICPFHYELTPSFYAHPTKGYNCFGCGAKGFNGIDFVMAHLKLPFLEAVAHVASLSKIYIGNDASFQPLPHIKPKQPLLIPKVDIIPKEVFEANTRACKQNNLHHGIAAKYGNDIADSLCIKYQIGHCKDGSTLFTQLDFNGNCRQAKKIMYNNAETLKRDKAISPNYIGKMALSKYSVIPYDNINLVQCYFGEHLLKGNDFPVCIVESEKTAMICSIFYPQFVWIGTGGKNGCKWDNIEVCKILKGRKILLYPDCDALEDWKSRAETLRLNTGCNVVVIDIMNGKPSPEGKEKYDLADMLINSKRQPRQILEISTVDSWPCMFLYDEMIVQSVVSNGNYYDVLFNPNGELFPTDDKIDGFIKGQFLGLPALIQLTSKLFPTIIN